jgi:uncharacterized phage protein (TIGR02220 family)
MRSVVIPLEFFKAIGEKNHHIRIYWIKWLAEYTDELYRPDFVEFFHSSMNDKKLNLKTIKEAYEFGMVYFKDGFNFIEENKNKKVNKKHPQDILDIVNRVIDYLNVKSQSTYTMSKANIDCIVSRIGEGFTISDFKRVIDKKVEQWIGTEQEKYLRPITLFQSKKFENYLNEPETKTKDAKRKPSNIEKLTIAANKAKQFFS